MLNACVHAMFNHSHNYIGLDLDLDR